MLNPEKEVIKEQTQSKILTIFRKTYYFEMNISWVVQKMPKWIITVYINVVANLEMWLAKVSVAKSNLVYAH